jgi:phosphoglycerate dehydrogenase-like enzyme
VSRVVVMGASEAAPPPGIVEIADAIDLVFADTEVAMADALADSDIVFAWRPRSGLLRATWEHAGAVRWVQAASAGIEDLLFEEMVKSPVVLTNARGVFDDAMAEYVVGMLLLFAKGLPAVIDRQRRREWLPRDSEQLAGKRVLVVGAGSIGHAIGRRCKGIGMLVRGVGTRARTRDDVFALVHAAEDLEEACGWADVVVNVLPSTPATRRRFDDAVFSAMLPSARFVNVGRGGTVDEAALIRALRDGTIAGAALDVFEREPLPEDSPLWDLPNVIVSPHMSADFAGWRETLVELFVENLSRYLSGRPLKNVVDKELGYVPS